jgi:hypothetical protein
MDVLKCGLEESQLRCESKVQDLKRCQLELDETRESLRREEGEVKCLQIKTRDLQRMLASVQQQVNLLHLHREDYQGQAIMYKT